MPTNSKPLHVGSCAFCGNEVHLFRAGVNDQLILKCEDAICEHQTQTIALEDIPMYVRPPEPLAPDEVVLMPIAEYFPSTYTWQEVFPYDELRPWVRRRMKREEYEALSSCRTPALAIVGEEATGGTIMLPCIFLHTLNVLIPVAKTPPQNVEPNA